MKLSRAADGFLLHKSAEGKSPTTTREYRRHLRLLIDYLGDPDVAAIKTADLRAFLDYLRTEYRPSRFSGDARPLSAKSLRNIWITLRSFYTWAAVELELPDALASLHPPQYQLPEIETLSEVEIRALLSACTHTRAADTRRRQEFRMQRPTARRDQSLIRFLLDTGLRASECARLNVGDVDVATGEVTVRPFRASRKSRPRHVYLGQRTQRALWRYLADREDGNDPNAPLFTTGAGDRLQADSMRHLLRRLGKRAGLGRAIYPHLFRHTFATSYIRNGGDIFSLQRLLGHSDMAMVRRYVTLVRADVQNAHRRASPVDVWRL